ncbi:hypothetical protein [Brevundimonas sp.]
MTDADRIEALLDLVDDTRKAQPAQSEQLAVLGYAERRPRGQYWPTRAGWNFLGNHGRTFDTQ